MHNKSSARPGVMTTVGALPPHAYTSSQLDRPLVSALLALQKAAEPGDELLRFGA